MTETLIALGLIGVLALWGLYDKITKGRSGFGIEIGGDDDDDSTIEDIIDVFSVSGKD